MPRVGSMQKPIRLICGRVTRPSADARCKRAQFTPWGTHRAGARKIKTNPKQTPTNPIIYLFQFLPARGYPPCDKQRIRNESNEANSIISSACCSLLLKLFEKQLTNIRTIRIIRRQRIFLGDFLRKNLVGWGNGCTFAVAFG